MIAIIEQSLTDNVGVTSIVVDGQQVSLNRDQALKELDYWKRRAAVESGRRGMFRGINLGSAW